MFSSQEIDSVAQFFLQTSPESKAQISIPQTDGAPASEITSGIRHILEGLGNLFHAIAASRTLDLNRSDMEMQNFGSSSPNSEFVKIVDTGEFLLYASS
jgi:hypothetical protein